MYLVGVVCTLAPRYLLSPSLFHAFDPSAVSATAEAESGGGGGGGSEREVEVGLENP